MNCEEYVVNQLLEKDKTINALQQELSYRMKKESELLGRLERVTDVICSRMKYSESLGIEIDSITEKYELPDLTAITDALEIDLSNYAEERKCHD